MNYHLTHLDLSHFNHFILSLDPNDNHLPQTIKAKTTGMITVKDFYSFLSGKMPITPKTQQETKEFREWKFRFWRPFSKTITDKNWNALKLEPQVGREGFIATFRCVSQEEKEKTP